MKQFVTMIMLVVMMTSSSPPSQQNECETLKEENEALKVALAEKAQLADDWHENFSLLRKNHLLLIEKLDLDGVIQCQDFGFYVDALNTRIIQGTSDGVPLIRQDTCSCIDQRMKY